MKEIQVKTNITSFTVNTKAKGINFDDFESAYPLFKALKKLKLEPKLLANFADSTSVQVF